MKLFIFSIYDTASASYMRPFCSLTDAQAMREFSDIVAIKDSPIGQHPEDYSLSRIGIFDDQNAKIDPQDREILLTGLEALAGRPPQEAEIISPKSFGGTD